jgi:hypothetical protein
MAITLVGFCKACPLGKAWSADLKRMVSGTADRLVTQSTGCVTRNLFSQ